MRFIMGGREFDLTPEQVRIRMEQVQPDPVQKHVVEVNNTDYPPKQVIGTCLGFPRTSFTTMEAQRVLNRLGFICRQANVDVGGTKPWIKTTGDGEPPSFGPQIDNDSLRAALITLQMAVAHLDERVMALESRGDRDAS